MALYMRKLHSVSGIFSHLQYFVQMKINLKKFFHISITEEEQQQTIDSIVSGIQFKGMNLWVLIFAIFIASLGLNVNSTAVIIGAMLISPLMGPIIGMGLSIGITDFDLLKRSLKNFGVATGISVLTATIYFTVTPLTEAQSELLARTSPNIYDVLIALFGGLAGIVAICAREKGNVLPGVAIATALMPPLCTAGYGIATGQWMYFFGAFYLYFINTVFITVATFVGVRMMNFPYKTYIDKKRGSILKRYIYIIVIATIIPSVVMTYSIVKESFYKSHAGAFINNEFNFSHTQVIQKEISYKNKEIRVVLMGEELPAKMIATVEQRMDGYKLKGTKLIVIQGINNSNNVDVSSIKTIVMKDLYEKNEKTIEEQRKQIETLENAAEQEKKFGELTMALSCEISTLFPGIKSLTLNRTVRCYTTDSIAPDTLCLATLSFDKQPKQEELTRLKNWLMKRTQEKNLEILY